MPTGIPPGPFRRTGLPALRSLDASTSTTFPVYGTRFDLGTAYSKWGFRVKVVGGSTEVIVQLLGVVASSSDNSTGSLVALTTFQLTANSCDTTLFVVDKPVTSVVAAMTTCGLSTGTQVSAFITACP